MKQIHDTRQIPSMRGFTLLELVLVVVLIGIVGLFAVAYDLDPAELTLPSQADRLASDIRLAQTLAFTSGTQVTVAGSDKTYAITPCSPPCTANNSPVTLKEDIAFQSGASVTFRTNGQPVSPTQFVLMRAGSTSTKAVDVNAQGHVTVTP